MNKKSFHPSSLILTEVFLHYEPYYFTSCVRWCGLSHHPVFLVVVEPGQESGRRNSQRHQPGDTLFTGIVAIGHRVAFPHGRSGKSGHAELDQ